MMEQGLLCGGGGDSLLLFGGGFFPLEITGAAFPF